MINFKEGLQRVKAFAFDVDGVLSSPKVYVNPDGDLIRTMNTKDGYAIQYAVKRGYPIAIITGGKSESVGMRFRNLGLTDIYLGSSDKVHDFDDFILKYGIHAEDVLYMGDDLPDFYVMQKAGVACAPSDAVEEIKAISDYVSHFSGGEGCVRDVIEQVLRLHGRWMDGEAFVW
ncbi:MAG TPA: 3-deoxy-D-manno-octulosonate 8-phosphate phosphatase [Bacteroidaceae bacterium]|nr:3-deoxy-D-manno-octulosonate 8-phosphate phosphatase [Bacteroidaceae bacterium]